MEKKKGINRRIKNVSAFILIIWTTIITLGWNDPGIRGTSVNVGSGIMDSTPFTYPDHIIFLWLENKGFNTIIGNINAPYINSVVKKGTLFTNTYAVTHPSYPNYVDFFAGDPNGVINDACINNSTLATPNLYTVLRDAGKSFAWYSEDLPMIGSKVCTSNNYVAKHNPTTIFSNVPNAQNKGFVDFPTNYTELENVVCISPNLLNDMHDGTVKQADTWLKNHLAALILWCTKHNSVFVIYFDESESDNDNRIPVIAIGQHVKTKYQLNNHYDHFSWTKTISAMFSASENWTNKVNAAKVIKGCWK
jgi:phosphatidylinositol-3-phosphatase